MSDEVTRLRIYRRNPIQSAPTLPIVYRLLEKLVWDFGINVDVDIRGSCPFGILSKGDIHSSFRLECDDTAYEKVMCAVQQLFGEVNMAICGFVLSLIAYTPLGITGLILGVCSLGKPNEQQWAANCAIGIGFMVAMQS